MAMLIEQAGGKAFAGPDIPILSIVPKDIQQRTPVILGSAAEVEHVLRHLRRS
jgi:fructose-1,6-bisphosphatase I